MSAPVSSIEHVCASVKGVAEPPICFFIFEYATGVSSLSQKSVGRVHTGETVSCRRAGILYLPYKGWRLGFGIFNARSLDCGRGEMDGWWSDGEKMRRGGDVIVNTVMFEFDLGRLE